MIGGYKMERCYACWKFFENIKNGYIKLNDLIVKTKICSECCKEEGFVKLLKKYDGSLFTVEKNEIKIDWHFFDKIFSRAWSQTNAEEKYALEFILKVLDIFNSSPDKNWLIVAERGAVLNPLGIDSILYFRRKKDICEYAKIHLFGVVFDWKIVKVAISL